MKKIVIASSASLQDEINNWIKKFESKGFEVINYPKPIDKEDFMKDYPAIHRNFFNCIDKTDILFLMNEDKKGIEGYIGAEGFAELCYAVVQKLNHNKNIEIFIRKMPSEKVMSYEEIVLWLKLGWIKIWEE